ncbi:MAG: GldG family protein, partial [Candidatus Neomarinimicrobiota bacterium]
MIKNKNSFIVFVGGLLVGLILLNLISRDNFHRFDLTDNKKFSLSPSSKTIVSKLDDRLTIKVYFSDDLPSELGNTRRFLQDILEEYQALSDDVSFFFHAPESDSELEEQARKDGIQPVQMQALENDQMVVKKVYLGMVLLFENKKEIIPLIQSTAGLEYMISTKIKSLINIDKKTIGLMALDDEEQPKTDNLTSQLNQHYNFRSVDPKTDIPENIDVLLVSGGVDS